MTNTIKTISIETLAEKINGKLWIKGDMKRIYLDEGYNTKKMSTKTYIFQRQYQTYGVSCSIDCPSQHDNWIQKEEESIIESVANRIDEIIEEFGFEIENPQIEIKAALDAEPQVQGYYMRWHEVRVAINSYGKLATRKRMQVHTFKGATSKAPGGFIELNDADFVIALQKESAETLYEYGCEPNLSGEAERISERNKQFEERQLQQKEETKIANEKKDEEKRLAAIELQNKIQSFKEQGITDPLLAWKELGCPHPAPAEVVEAKNASGLNWKSFTETIGK